MIRASSLHSVLWILATILAVTSNAAEPSIPNPPPPVPPNPIPLAAPATPATTAPDKRELPSWREDLKVFEMDALLKTTEAERAAGVTPYRKLLEAKAIAAERLVRETEVTRWDANVDQMQYTLRLEAYRIQRDADLDLAKSRDERLTCRQVYYDSVLAVFRKVELLFRSTSKGGDGHTYYKFRYEMLRAKAEWMTEAGENR
jgi:hypothetical protein